MVVNISIFTKKTMTAKFENYSSKITTLGQRDYIFTYLNNKILFMKILPTVLFTVCTFIFMTCISEICFSISYVSFTCPSALFANII